jgi:hypothetical protein
MLALDQLSSRSGNPVSQWRTWPTFHRPDVLNSVPPVWRPSHAALGDPVLGQAEVGTMLFALEVAAVGAVGTASYRQGHRLDVAACSICVSWAAQPGLVL